jgi:pimeloyl-ACP methyl ester carboxylesterase
VEITLPDGKTMMINYNCTSVPTVNATSQPTFWFTASPAHGVVDFMGVQTALAEVHGRNSCSYDPPNFGWSSRLPSSVSSSFDPLQLLVERIGRKSEEKIMAAWGGGGNTALGYAVAFPNITKSLVLLDVSPDGIEWLDKQRVMNWTTDQMLQYRHDDLDGRIELAQLVLAGGVPW